MKQWKPDVTKYISITSEVGELLDALVNRANQLNEGGNYISHSDLIQTLIEEVGKQQNTKEEAV